MPTGAFFNLRSFSEGCGEGWGNVRLSFTSKDETVNETATYETANQNTEQSQFVRYHTAKRINSSLFDRTNGAAPGFAQRLNGSTNERYGIAKSISVMPGDVINAEVYVKYVDPVSSNWNSALTTLMGQIAASTAGVVVDGSSYTTSTSSFPYAGLLTTTTTGAPRAYLNWLVFDRNFGFITGGFRQMGSGAKETGTDVAHELLTLPAAITITQPGYVYIYLSNESMQPPNASPVPVDVFFDDFKVTHTKSPVIQAEEYYPFGLTFNSYSRENQLGNDYLYNGKEEQDELGLAWLDYGARMYMPEIGKWGVVDEYAEIYYDHTTYNYVKNNPISAFDPNGKWVVTINSTTNSNGSVSYSLSFTAEKGDDLETLSQQLGISQEELLEAHPELANKKFKEGKQIGLGNLEIVQEINNTMNSVASKQDEWNCANFAGAPNCASLPDQWTGSTDNTSLFASQLKAQYESVDERQTSIGSVIHYRLKDEAKTKSYIVSVYVKQLKKLGLSDAEIRTKLADPKTQAELTNVTKMTMANERHFSVVVLKDRSGCVQNIIQKSGRNPFTFKVNHVNEVANELPYAPTPVEGTKTPYYNKTKN